MNNAPRASQLSGSTAFGGSTASLSSLASAATIVPAGPVVATSNIINQKADASRSLYQICVSLKTRLSQVPNFDGYYQDLERDAAQGPVESLWALLRTGHPLLTIYNSINPSEPLKIDGPNANAAENKKQKIAVFKFVQACLKDMNIPPAQCFVISDLLGNDTTGFVKVCYLRDIWQPRVVVRYATVFKWG
jgi:cell division control protein 24